MLYEINSCCPDCGSVHTVDEMGAQSFEHND